MEVPICSKATGVSAMKSILIVAVVLLVLLTAGLAFALFDGKSAPSAEEAGQTPASSAAAPAAGASAHHEDETLARLDALSAQMTEIKSEMAALKASASRESVPEQAREAKPEAVEAAAAMTPVQRDAILKVIADDRAEQKRKADEEQAQRDLQNALARADRAAQKYGLNVDQRKGLVDVFVADAQKSTDLRNQMMNQGFNGDREAMRKAFTDLDTWRMDELTKRMGPDLAQQVHDGEFPGMFGGGPPGGGRRGNRGAGGGGGPGGG
jgi:hypothetical protein